MTILKVATSVTKTLLIRGVIPLGKDGQYIFIRNWNNRVEQVKEIVTMNLEKDWVMVQLMDNSFQTMSLEFLCENIEVHERELPQVPLH